MKNQYFGDIRDLFKYDLIQWILTEIHSLRRFTFIPMLTEYDPKRRDGDKRDFNRAKKDGRPGTNNEKLIGCLKKYGEIDKDKRDFTKIGNYFKSEGIEVLTYKDKEHEYFEHTVRDRYFENIPGEYLHNPLIFIDPDIGLQVKNSTKKHLLYRQVKALYDRMDEDSILMIYQHFPRARYTHKEYLPQGRSIKLKEVTGNLPIWITDNEIIFFILTKNDELKSQLARVINRYKENYPKRIKRSPLFIITAGLVGTGKTTVAQALAERLGFATISSDVTRKRLANIPPTEHRFEGFHSGIYSSDFSAKTYKKILDEASEFLSQGQSVILDASFSRKEDRLQALKLAEALGANFIVLECVLNEENIKKRLEQRLARETTSDGRWEIYEIQKQTFEPITELLPRQYFILDTSQPIDKIVELIWSKL